MYRVIQVTPEGNTFTMDYCMLVHAERAQVNLKRRYPNDEITIQHI